MIPSKYGLVLCLDADRRVGTADRDRDTGLVVVDVPGGVLAVAGGHSQGQGDHPGRSVVVAGAVQVVSSAAALLNVPISIGLGGPRVRSDIIR